MPQATAMPQQMILHRIELKVKLLHGINFWGENSDWNGFREKAIQNLFLNDIKLTHKNLRHEEVIYSLQSYL